MFKGLKHLNFSEAACLLRGDYLKCNQTALVLVGPLVDRPKAIISEIPHSEVIFEIQWINFRCWQLWSIVNAELRGVIFVTRPVCLGTVANVRKFYQKF